MARIHLFIEQLLGGEENVTACTESILSCKYQPFWRQCLFLNKSLRDIMWRLLLYTVFSDGKDCKAHMDEKRQNFLGYEKKEGKETASIWVTLFLFFPFFCLSKS